MKLARTEPAFRKKLMRRWEAVRDSVEPVTTPTGLKLPRLALPVSDDAGEIARYLFGEGLPGEFPFVNAVYRRMYQDTGEEPTRLFAGLGLAEDTNKRFHYLTHHQKSIRLSTAFDGPTLYGLDSDTRACSARSAKAAWPSTRSKTCSGCTPASRTRTNISRSP